MRRLPGVRIQDAHAANERRQLGRGERQHARPLQQQLFRGALLPCLEVVAEPVCGGFEHGERLHVGPLLRRVRAPRREGDSHVMPGVPGGLLDACAPGQHDQVGEGDPLPAGLRAVEVRLDPLQRLQHRGESGFT